MSTEAPERAIHAVAIIGTGFAGLCAAIKLLEFGERDFIILERADSVGGTWRDNHYPGCACDVPSILYSLSFEQNPDWSRIYPSQPELEAYLQRVAEKHGLLPRIRFGHMVQGATYDEQAKLWHLETSQGRFSARVLISGGGGLSEPVTPQLPGLGEFKGKVFHSAQWDHGYDLAGKRVAVVGTGASAIQVIPAIAPVAGHVDVYQRTPAWVAPRGDRPIGVIARRIRHTPLIWAFRCIQYLLGELSATMFVVWPSLLRLAQKLVALHIKKQVPDLALRDKLTPRYTMGCKRVLVSDDYYPAMCRENVSLITDGIRTFTSDGITTEDGTLREVDAVIFCTGFQATDNPMATRVRGRGGLLLSEAWRNGEEAYLGTVVHGFPNFYLIVGPNTGIGHTSMVFMIEAQVHYIIECLRAMHAARQSTLEVRDDVQARYNQRLQERMGRTVWSSGCKSWYLNKNGKNTTLWPWHTFVFWWRLRRWREEDFVQPS